MMMISLSSLVLVTMLERRTGEIYTHTGGYNPNGNSLAERRIGMFNQLVRVYLPCATRGRSTS